MFCCTACNSGQVNVLDNWKPDGTSVNILWLDMASHRFAFKQLNMRFDNIEDRNQQKLDKPTPIVDIFEAFDKSCRDNYCIESLKCVNLFMINVVSRVSIPNKQLQNAIKPFAL